MKLTVVFILLSTGHLEGGTGGGGAWAETSKTSRTHLFFGVVLLV